MVSPAGLDPLPQNLFGLPRGKWWSDQAVTWYSAHNKMNFGQYALLQLSVLALRLYANMCQQYINPSAAVSASDGVLLSQVLLTSNFAFVLRIITAIQDGDHQTGDGGPRLEEYCMVQRCWS